MNLRTVLSFILAFMLTNSLLLAREAHANRNFSLGDSQEFPMTTMVGYQTQFWYLIFSRFTTSHVVIHDTVYPNIIVDVIDFAAFAERYNQGQPYTRDQRREIFRRYLNRYETALERVRRDGGKVARSQAMEQRVLSVYSNHPEGMKHLMSGQASLRTQTGLADEFARAAERAQLFLPYMERIFTRHNLPIELTRIAFVESMFNERALSKVGASGIWQFMPATARDFMMVDRNVDERNSPIKASEAAARLLTHNYRRLKAWPLAITAYNHGAGGMSRAVRQTGTRDIDHIIRTYQSPSFGFASRNFYAEFLAAKAVYETRYRHKFSPPPNPLNISNIRLPRPMSIGQLIANTPLDEDTLRRYNGCLGPQLFQGNRNQSLPRNYELLIPQSMAHEVRAAMNRIVISQNSRQGNRS